MKGSGWLLFPGGFHVLRYRASVAICTLNGADLARRIADHRPSGVAIAGTLHTENLGIERTIRNVLANPNIRFLVLSGEDAQQEIGHLPGQSLAALFREGWTSGAGSRAHRGNAPSSRTSPGSRSQPSFARSS